MSKLKQTYETLLDIRNKVSLLPHNQIFNMTDYQMCVLGVLYGSYHKGLSNTKFPTLTKKSPKYLENVLYLFGNYLKTISKDDWLLHCDTVLSKLKVKLDKKTAKNKKLIYLSWLNKHYLGYDGKDMYITNFSDPNVLVFNSIDLAKDFILTQKLHHSFSVIHLEVYSLKKCIETIL